MNSITTGNNTQSIQERRQQLEDRFKEWPRHTIAQHFQQACEQSGNEPFLYIHDQQITYNHVWTEAQKYAKSLLHIGVKRRDHIAVCMENDATYPSLMIAASMVGAVLIPINTMLSKDELGYILSQSDTRVLFFHDHIRGNHLSQSIRTFLDDVSFQEDNVLEHLICTPTTEDSLDERFTSWSTFEEGAREVSEDTLEKRWKSSLYPDEIGMIMYTSGSTGKPKGVMLTHDMLLRCAYSTCISRAIEKGRATFAPLPFYHCFAIVEGILAMSFVGGSLISAPVFTPLSALEMMEKYKANDLLCVPTMLVPLLNHPKLKDFDLSNLFAMWCGAAPAPAHVWQRAVDELGLTEILTGYGQTEVTSSGVTTELDDPIERIVTRVGRPKLGGSSGLKEFNGSNVEYKTIDPITLEDLPHGSIGELTVRGNTITNGYYNKPEETAHAIDKDGWLRTGDVGIIDEHGYLQVLGRSTDLYKVSGELVAPKETEDVISKHPAVNQVYIVGVPDRMTSEAGAAFIELKEDATCTRREIVEWCADKVARFKIPRHVWFIEGKDWPMTSTGKIQKFRLKELAEEKRKK